MEKNKAKINTGTSLILVICVVMCLVTFALLAYSSAVSDRELSVQAAARTKEYYSACNAAEERLRIYEINPVSREPYMDGDELAFTEDCGDNHYLSIRAKVNPETGELEVTEWIKMYKERENECQ